MLRCASLVRLRWRAGAVRRIAERRLRVRRRPDAPTLGALPNGLHLGEQCVEVLSRIIYVFHSPLPRFHTLPLAPYLSPIFSSYLCPSLFQILVIISKFLSFMNQWRVNFQHLKANSRTHCEGEQNV